MELRHLRYFAAVAATLNFTRAAARLRVAQPALSRQMRDLEDELGVDLLRRNSRGVTLTPEGRFFYGEVQRLLAEADDSVRKLRALAHGEFGELHIGYAPSPSAELLPAAVEAFQKSVPGVKLVLHDLAGDELSDGLRSGALDLSIMLRPTSDKAGELTCEVLRAYPFCAAVPPLHPFARRRSVPLVEALAGRLVVLRRSDYSDYHRLLQRLCEFAGVRLRIAAECDSGPSLFTEVQAGRGLAILPSVFRHAAGARLVLRPLTPASLPQFEVVAASKGPASPAAARFLAFLRRRAGSASRK